MGKDVKAQVPEAPEAEVEVETTVPASQPEKETAVIPEAKGEEVPTPEKKEEQPALEKTVPYSRFSEVNKKFRDLQRKLAEDKGTRSLEGMEPNDMETIFSHPFVQSLLIKQAKQELTDYAREILEDYPKLHPSVKKAILKNARGFVNEETNDVETAKLDLLEYIESILEEEIQAPTPSASKNFPVAATNAPTVEAPVRPEEVAKILAKPIDEWTEDETKVVEDYTKSMPKK